MEYESDIFVFCISSIPLFNSFNILSYLVLLSFFCSPTNSVLWNLSKILIENLKLFLCTLFSKARFIMKILLKVYNRLSKSTFVELQDKNCCGQRLLWFKGKKNLICDMNYCGVNAYYTFCDINNCVLIIICCFVESFNFFHDCQVNFGMKFLPFQ